MSSSETAGSAIDPDDPETWPDDLASLEALATGGMAPDWTKGFSESAEPVAKSVAKDEAEETDAPKQAPEKDPEWVLTADGKHALPYEYLQAAREQAAQATQQAQAYRERLEALAAGQPPAQAPVQAEAPSGIAGGELATAIAEMEQLYAQTKDEDEELARAYHGTLLALRGQQRLEQRLEADVRQREQAAMDAQGDDIQAAIGRNPVMAEMVADAGWFERARQVEQMLSSDPRSAYSQAKDWDGRFAAVAEAAQAIYGVHPAAGKLRAVNASGPTRKAVKVEDLPDPVPASISSFGAGEVDHAQDGETAALARMSPAEMMTHLNKLASAGKLTDLVYRVS
jgi:hypothetical protein